MRRHQRHQTESETPLSGAQQAAHLQTDRFDGRRCSSLWVSCFKFLGGGGDMKIDCAEVSMNNWNFRGKKKNTGYWGCLFMFLKTRERLKNKNSFKFGKVSKALDSMITVTHFLTFDIPPRHLGFFHLLTPEISCWNSDVFLLRKSTHLCLHSTLDIFLQ